MGLSLIFYIMQVRVHVRVRPLILASARSTVPIRGIHGSYEVDEVFDEACSQEDVFQCVALPAVNSFLQVGEDRSFLSLQWITNAASAYGVYDTANQR